MSGSVGPGGGPRNPAGNGPGVPLGGGWIRWSAGWSRPGSGPSVGGVPDSPWQAVAQPPAAFLRSSWPWRSAGYLAGGVAVGLGCLLALVLLGVLGVLLVPALGGLGLLAGLVLSGIGYAAGERRRLGLVCPDPLPAGRRAPPASGPAAWLLARLRERATWRELGFLALSGTLLWPLELAVLTAGLLLPAVTLTGPVLAGSFPAAFPAGAQLLREGWLWLS